MLPATARPPPDRAPGGVTGTGGWRPQSSHRTGGTGQSGARRLAGFRRPLRGVAGGNGPGGPGCSTDPAARLAHDPGWIGAGRIADRLDQLWMVKSELSVAGVPICTW
jgi:hypothetical protein